MSKKSSSFSGESVTEIPAVVEKHRKKKKSKKTTAVDLGGIEEAMKANFIDKADEEAEAHIRQALAISQKGVGSKIEEEPQLSSIQKKILKAKKAEQERESRREAKTKETEDKSKDDEYSQQTSDENNYNSTETAKDLIRKGVEEETEIKHPTDQEDSSKKYIENGKAKAKRLKPLISFVRNHRNSLIKELESETDANNAIILEGKISKANHKIDVLEKTREVFLNPNKENTLTEEGWEEAEEIRNDVLSRMEFEKGINDEEESDENLVQEEKINNEGEAEKKDEEPTLDPSQESEISNNDEVGRVEDLIPNKNSNIPNTSVNKEKKESQTKKKKEIFDSKPLKTAYEKAIERQDAIDRGDIVRKPFVMSENNNEAILSPNDKELSLEDKIEKTRNFDELLAFLETIEGIAGKEKWFSKYSLIGRINLVRAGEITLDYIPTEFLKNKVASCLLNNTSSDIETSKSTNSAKPIQKDIKVEEEKGGHEEMPSDKISPSKTPFNRVKILSEKDNVPNVDNTPTIAKPVEITEDSLNPSSSTESPKEESVLRKEIKYLFRDELASQLSKIKLARIAYGKQLKIETQHNHSQTKRIGLIAKLMGKRSEKKVAANIVELQKAEAEYKASIENYKGIINDEGLNKKAIDKVREHSDRGLQIITEEKAKLFEEMQKTLIEEKGLVQKLKEEGLPENERGVINKLTNLYSGTRGGRLKMLEPINKTNTEDNA